MAEQNQKPTQNVTPQKRGKVYTYVGKGENPPRKINFMTLQEFVRGKAVEVTNPEVLAKVAKHPCFVEGEVGAEVLEAQDEKAAAEAEVQRHEDKKVNDRFKKEQRKLAAKGEED